MKKFVKIFVILGIVLCLCGGIVTAAGYIGGGLQELTGKVSSSIPAVQSAKAQESLTFSPNEIGRLEFRLNSENIAFHPSGDGQIHIRYRTRDDVTYTTYRAERRFRWSWHPGFHPKRHFHRHPAVPLRHGN